MWGAGGAGAGTGSAPSPGSGQRSRSAVAVPGAFCDPPAALSLLFLNSQRPPGFTPSVRVSLGPPKSSPPPPAAAYHHLAPSARAGVLTVTCQLLPCSRPAPPQPTCALDTIKENCFIQSLHRDEARRTGVNPLRGRLRSAPRPRERPGARPAQKSSLCSSVGPCQAPSLPGLPPAAMKGSSVRASFVRAQPRLLCSVSVRGSASPRGRSGGRAAQARALCVRLGPASAPAGPVGLRDVSPLRAAWALPAGLLRLLRAPPGLLLLLSETSGSCDRGKWETGGGREQLGSTACLVLGDTSQTQKDTCPVTPT